MILRLVWLRWLPVLAWIGLITYWSSQSQVPLDHPKLLALFGEARDKVAHAVAFGMLGFLARLAFHGSGFAGVRAVALASIFGAIDEWHQSFTPGRTPDLTDWLVDAAAAVVCVVVMDALLQVMGSRISTGTWAERWPRVRVSLTWRLAPVLAAGAMVLLLAGVSVVKQRSPASVAFRAVEVTASAAERVIPDRVERRVVAVAQAGVDTARQVRNGIRDRLPG